MSEFNPISLAPILPELFMAVAGMVLLVAGVFRGNEGTRFITWATIGVLIMAGFVLAGEVPNGVPVLNDMFVLDSFAYYMKFLVIGGLVVSLMLAIQYLDQERMAKFEYPLIVLFSGVGMLLMISANDMLAMYMGLELQSLSLYILASIKREHVKSAESGMKYFVLGAISSGILLFGISLIYGYTASTNFEVIANSLAKDVSIGAVLGFVFVLAGLSFKISAVPFHMWTPDVYEGAPTSVTALFAIVPKVAALALIVRVLFVPFMALSEQWFQMVWFLSFASMMVGAFAALRQENIKRLMAYSSIGNMGYVLIGIVAGGDAGISSMLVYLTIYMVMTAGVFGIILCMRLEGVSVQSISDLAGLSQHRPFLAYSMAILMFSMSGIPPMAGFFGKFMIFQSAVESGLYTLAVLGVLSSVVAAYYYLRIIKTMFFDTPAEKFDTTIELSRRLVILFSVLLTLGFVLYPSLLVETAEIAVGSLFDF